MTSRMKYESMSDKKKDFPEAKKGSLPNKGTGRETVAGGMGGHLKKVEHHKAKMEHHKEKMMHHKKMAKKK